MPVYQEALKLVVEKKYEESKAKLQETIKEIESVIGSPYTAYHLFVLQRLASVQKLLEDAQGLEATFLQCTHIADKLYPRNKEDAGSRFMWQNNLLKFYIEYDIDKACDLGSDLLADYQAVLNSQDLVDL